MHVTFRYNLILLFVIIVTGKIQIKYNCCLELIQYNGDYPLIGGQFFAIAGIKHSVIEK